MDRIGVRELRQNASKYLGQVKSGRSIEVTEHGTPIAALVPIDSTSTVMQRLVANGDISGADGDMREWLLAHPPVRAPDSDGTSVSVILDEQRAERL